MVLEGCAETIRRFHPVIMIEMAGHGSRVGVSDESLRARIESAGYREIYRHNVDVAFAYDR